MQQLFLGIDGGGSKSKAVLTTAERHILGEGVAGPGNPSHGFKQATTSIVESALLAIESAGLTNKISLNNIIVGAGLAGVNIPQMFDEISAWQHPFKQLYLTTDPLIACLGAHQGCDGAIIIIGTGSCGFSYVNGEVFTVGGHGFPQGDKASGAWFGLQAVQQVLLSLDRLIPTSVMNELLLNKLQCGNAIALVDATTNYCATDYARLAHIVFDAAAQEDKQAQALINEGANYIDAMATLLFEQGGSRLSLIGGLVSSIQPWFSQALQNKILTPQMPPELGGVLFAQQQHAINAEAKSFK